MYPKKSFISQAAIRLLCCGVSLLAVMQHGSIVLGDEIRTATQTYLGATIRKFDGEFVIFSNAEGKVIAQKLSDISTIFVDSVNRLDSFNQAERLYQQGKYRPAAARYREAITRARSFWKNLIRVRYMSACDQAGELDKAVQAYILLAQALPEKADRFMPGNIAAAPADQQAEALRLLGEALPKVSTQAAYWHLEALRLSILEVTESEEAGKLANEIIARLQGRVGDKSHLRLQMIALRIEIKHQQYEVALKHINVALNETGDVYLPELLFLKGKCLFETAVKREDFMRAGLAFMRVIIHFPKSRFCAESMYGAGCVHEKIKRFQKAIELYQGCQELPGADDQIRRLASSALERLRSSG